MKNPTLNKITKKKISEAKTPQFKLFPKLRKMVDQWSLQSISILQGFQNTLTPNYSRM